MELEIHYVMGSGNHARSYLHRTAQNRLIEMPVGWYPEQGGLWAMSPGFDRANHPDFRRNVGYSCMFCHNAYPAIPAGGDTFDADPIYPAELPSGIDCQRCHGPGKAHAAAAQAKQPPEKVRAADREPQTSDRRTPTGVVHAVPLGIDKLAAAVQRATLRARYVQLFVQVGRWGTMHCFSTMRRGLAATPNSRS